MMSYYDRRPIVETSWTWVTSVAPFIREASILIEGCRILTSFACSMVLQYPVNTSGTDFLLVSLCMLSVFVTLTCDVVVDRSVVMLFSCFLVDVFLICEVCFRLEFCNERVILVI